MTIEKNYQGAYVVTDTINGYLVQRVYMGYTKKEARQRFQEYKRDLKQ